LWFGSSQSSMPRANSWWAQAQMQSFVRQYNQDAQSVTVAEASGKTTELETTAVRTCGDHAQLWKTMIVEVDVQHLNPSRNGQTTTRPAINVERSATLHTAVSMPVWPSQKSKLCRKWPFLQSLRGPKIRRRFDLSTACAGAGDRIASNNHRRAETWPGCNRRRCRNIDRDLDGARCYTARTIASAATCRRAEQSPSRAHHPATAPEFQWPCNRGWTCADRDK